MTSNIFKVLSENVAQTNPSSRHHLLSSQACCIGAKGSKVKHKSGASPKAESPNKTSLVAEKNNLTNSMSNTTKKD